MDMMNEIFLLQASPAAHTAMNHFHILTLDELEQAWESRKRISVRQNSEASVASLEDLVVSVSIPHPFPLVDY